MYSTTDTREGGSLFSLIAGLREDVRNLFHEEVQLAKTEVSEKVSMLGRNGVYLATGGVVALIAVVFLLMAIAFIIAFGFQALGLSAGVSLFLGFLVVALISGLIGGILVGKALSAFKKESLVPDKTLQTLKDIKEGGLEQVPMTYRPVPPPEDHRNSEQIRSDLERTRSRIGREVRGIRTHLSMARLATGVVSGVTSNPMRSMKIGLGTTVAGYVLLRVARLFGRRHAA